MTRSALFLAALFPLALACGRQNAGTHEAAHQAPQPGYAGHGAAGAAASHDEVTHGHGGADARAGHREAGDTVAHQHDARHGGQLGMAGEHHIEVVRAAPGDYRVYLSDARRAAVSTALIKAPRLIVDPDAETPEVLPLAAAPAGYFAARGRAVAEDPLPVRVELTLAGAPLAMDFFLPAAK
jgi:hypothetical protein